MGEETRHDPVAAGAGVVVVVVVTEDHILAILLRHTVAAILTVLCLDKVGDRDSGREL